MNNVIWKAFKIGYIFERSTKLALGLNQKNLNISKEKDETHGIALISASRNGSGCVGYLRTSDVDQKIVSFNKITFDDQWGYTFFQQEKFVITGGHNAILEIVNVKLRTLLDINLFCYSFLSLILNTTTIKTGIYGYGYKINNKLDREIILLPCLEIPSSDEYIWEENGHYYTLAVDYVKKLMDEAKELREQKTIRLYEAERVKYEAERVKYEAGYLREKGSLEWKGFRLGELFEYSSKHFIKEQMKNLQILEFYVSGSIANVTASMENNGIVGYIKENDEINKKKVKNVLTLAPDAAYAGVCFYQKDFVVSTGHNKVIDFLNMKLKELCINNEYIFFYLAKIITKNFCKTFYGFSKSINENDFNKTPILLPCIECSQEESLWIKDGKFYTLAGDYLSYLYLSGRINFNQKLVDNYTYQY